jgi:hypothetical protein
MGPLKEADTRAVLDRAATREAGAHEWWTAVSFEDGDQALEPDPLLTSTEQSVDEIELRLYSL